MTDLSVIHGEVVEPRALTDIEASIKGHMATMVRGTWEAFEARIAIGHDLLDAREHFGEDDKRLGQWAKQNFPWSRQWRQILIQAAENEAAVRVLLTSQLDGKALSPAYTPNFEQLVKDALLHQSSDNGQASERAVVIPATGTYPTIVIDPPWAYDNKATRNAAAKQYPTLTQAQLCAVEMPAASDSHLYLWVTNNFLRDGFDLLEAWGFAYKTMLTWVKPQFGLGNYFRSATEHVLFGLKGTLPTNGKDVPNWFKADRKQHSLKPQLFYDIVEQVSPGPYLEMFARQGRLGWDVWGDEV